MTEQQGEYVRLETAEKYLARALAAEDRLAAVKALADKWEADAGPDSQAWKVFGPQVVSVPFAVEQIRSALDLPINRPEVPEVCSCGNRFDGDNLCMISACQWEGIEER